MRATNGSRLYLTAITLLALFAIGYAQTPTQATTPAQDPVAGVFVKYVDPMNRELPSKDRQGVPVIRVVVHDTDEITVARTFDVLFNRQLAYHYVIDTDGTAYQFVDPKLRVSHASGANDDSIGISFVAGDNADYQQRLAKHEKDLPVGTLAIANQKQLDSAVALLKYLHTEFPTITIVEGHKDVEARLFKAGVKGHYPSRKNDPFGINVDDLKKRAGI